MCLLAQRSHPCQLDSANFFNEIITRYMIIPNIIHKTNILNLTKKKASKFFVGYHSLKNLSFNLRTNSVMERGKKCHIPISLTHLHSKLGFIITCGSWSFNNHIWFIVFSQLMVKGSLYAAFFWKLKNYVYPQVFRCGAFSHDLCPNLSKISPNTIKYVFFIIFGLENRSHLIYDTKKHVVFS